MPPARRSAATSQSSRATKGGRAGANSTSAGTRREVEQSIARFEKRLDDANDALQTLGKHLGRGAQSSYKEVTAAMRALRRDAAKTNRQALKDFDKLRAAITQKAPGRASSRSKANAGSSTASSGSSRSSGRSSGSRTSSRSTASRSTGSRRAASRGTASKSSGSRSRSTRTKSSGSKGASS